MTLGIGDPWDRLRDYDFNFGQAKKCLDSGDLSEALKWVGRCSSTPESRAIEAQTRYRLASEMIMERRFAEAEVELGRIPHDSSISRFLIEERIRLLRKRREATSDLREMAQRFGGTCDSCRGKDLYTIATCRHQAFGVPAVLKLKDKKFPSEIKGVYAAAPYRTRWDNKKWADPMSRLLRMEKREVQRPAVRFMGYLLASYMCHHTPLVGAVDALVPVPTSASRAEVRGGCIPLELAEAIRDELAIPIRDVIKPIGDYEDHLKVKGKAREQALRRAWDVPEDPVLQCRSVAVVDDIITTGTTMKTAARVLLEQGVGSVFALSLCHTESRHSATT